MKIEGYSNYEVYPEEGKVWSYFSNKFIGDKHIEGYWKLAMIDDNGKKHHLRLHRVVWEAVNGKIPEGMEINHIDENKSNNSITNLSLVTPKENTNWGTRNERVAKKLSKPILLVVDDKVQKFFPSDTEARRQGYRKESNKDMISVVDFLADWWDKEMDKFAN